MFGKKETSGECAHAPRLMGGVECVKETTAGECANSPSLVNVTAGEYAECAVLPGLPSDSVFPGAQIRVSCVLLTDVNERGVLRTPSITLFVHRNAPTGSKETHLTKSA
ncbi:hypothetical protein BaRGS_00012892 [Batillaria attramentaria]|uniref:Uncharacterized protein n=1 Tax=Batillaria attramentaria TaxID=370345 RepID=A0ABD0L8W0_9CAEN